MRSIRFSKIRVSEFCKDSGRLGCRVGALDVRTAVGIKKVSAMATNHFTHGPHKSSNDHTSMNRGMQAFDNQFIFDRNNTAETGQSSARSQGELMNIGKHGERLNAASYEGYMKKTNEKQGKARCK